MTSAPYRGFIKSTFLEGGFFNYNFHSIYSEKDKGNCLKTLNSQIKSTSDYLRSAKVLIITFGSAWFYVLNNNSEVVTNCYKMPSSIFKKKLLDLEESKKVFSQLINSIKRVNSNIEIIISVSPVRHLKDGVEENQISKSILLLLAHFLSSNFEGIYYFPAYEIMMDELRDYRFYKDDMLHPSDLAKEVIWEKFCGSCLTNNTLDHLPKILEIIKATRHVPVDSDSRSFKNFVKNQIEKIEVMSSTLPQLNFSKELRYFNQFL